MAIPLSVPLALPWDIGKKERRDGIACAKRSRTRFVLRVDCAGPEWGERAGQALYVKRYLNPYWRRKIGSLFGVSKARSEARASAAVLALGIATPQVVGFWTTWNASYLATIAMEGLTPLGDALAALPAGDPDREGLWRAAGRFTALVWRLGAWHPDFFEDHLCLRVATEDAARLGKSDASPSDDDLRAAFALLDVDGMALGSSTPSMARRLHSAAQMLKSCGAPGRDDARDREGRLAYLEGAFAMARADLERDTLPKLLACARKEGLATGLEEFGS